MTLSTPARMVFTVATVMLATLPVPQTFAQLSGEIRMFANAGSKPNIRVDSPNPDTLQPDLTLNVSNIDSNVIGRYSGMAQSGVSMNGAPSFSLSALSSESRDPGSEQGFEVNSSAESSMTINDTLRFVNAAGETPSEPFTVSFSYFIPLVTANLDPRPPDPVVSEDTEASFQFTLRLRGLGPGDTGPSTTVGYTYATATNRFNELPNVVENGSRTDTVTLTLQPGQNLDLFSSARVETDAGRVLLNGHLGWGMGAVSGAEVYFGITEIISTEGVTFLDSGTGLDYIDVVPEPSAIALLAAGLLLLFVASRRRLRLP